MTKKHSLNEAQEVYICDDTLLDLDFSEGQQALGKESLAIAKEIHIPDYVMLDFGFPKRTRTSRKLRA